MHMSDNMKFERSCKTCRLGEIDAPVCYHVKGENFGNVTEISGDFVCDNHSTIWFTSDWHLFHWNILKYCERPFTTEGQMRSYIKGKYNKYVFPNDLSFNLGDLCLLPSYQSSRLMNAVLDLKGQKHLILGNHDRMFPNDYLDRYFMSIHTSLEVVFRGKKYILAHDPAITTMYRDSTILHGHVHRHWKYKYDQVNRNHLINVCVDVWDFKPVNIYQIESLIKEIETSNKESDNND